MTRYGSISELLDELAPTVDNELPAWDDVLARSELLAGSGPSNGHIAHTRLSLPEGAASLRRRRRTVPRRTLLLVALGLIALIAVVAAAAYALGHPVIKFGEAPHARSRTVVNFFGRATVGVPTGIAVLPHKARLISSVRIDGVEYPLWIAPIRGGGFCYAWGRDSVNACLLGHQPRSLSVGGTATPRPGPEWVNIIGGSFPQALAARVRVQYADGQSADIPFVWVTRPISSGFFLYGIPQAHQRTGHQATRIALLDSSGAVIASQPFRGLVPPARHLPYRLVRHQLAGYPPQMVPAPAVWAKRQQLFSWSAASGIRVGLWTAPARAGGTCYWSNLSTGCGRSQPNWPKLRRGQGYVALCCTIASNIVRLELNFQDGDRIKLTPKNGYLIWPIPARHYPPGHRLNELVGYDATGRQIATRAIAGNHRGLYPCAKPKSYGYGISMCP